MATGSLLFALPKLFEVSFIPEKGGLFPSAMRLNQNYVVWYQCVLKLVATGLVPLAALAYFNLRIALVLVRTDRENRGNSLQLNGVAGDDAARTMSVHRHQDTSNQVNVHCSETNIQYSIGL